jgi:hypothetical protein
MRPVLIAGTMMDNPDISHQGSGDGKMQDDNRHKTWPAAGSAEGRGNAVGSLDGLD